LKQGLEPELELSNFRSSYSHLSRAGITGVHVVKFILDKEINFFLKSYIREKKSFQNISFTENTTAFQLGNLDSV
jgi:hypothetical protein